MSPAPPHDRDGGRAPLRCDRGFSLVEVVISIVLMGTVLVAVLTAVSVAIRASSVSRDAAQVETVVVNVADRLNRAPFSCQQDHYRQFAVAAVRSQGWWTNEGEYARAAQVRTEFYDPSVSPPWREGTQPCPLEDFGKQRVQRITVTITSPDRSVSRTIQVVKVENV
jgi:prepilin-type N-terminal cleavage/methylation domain-containing protein